MFRNFNRNLQIGYGISVLMLVIIGFISYRTVGQLLESDRAVAHSNLIMQKLERAISLMKDAETGQRGYLLTNRDQFLEPYNGAYPQASELVNQVAQLTIDDQIQQHNMQAIRLILQQRMTILQSLIDKRRQGHAITATDLDAGKAAMDALRRAVSKAENDEQALLDQRAVRLSHYSLLAPLFIGSAILLGVLISLWSYFKVTGDIKVKDRLQSDLAVKEQETAAINEELTAANEELTATNEELMEAREEIAVINQSLEEKVVARTKALQESEQETQALNEELNAINEELAAANEEYQATNEELLHSRDEIVKGARLFRAITRNIPGSLVMVIGPDHTVLTLEGDLLDRLHYDKKGVEGKHLAEITSAERYEASLELYQRVLAGEQFRVGRKGEAGTEYQVDFVPLRDEAEKVYAGLILVLDITELKKSEERSAKLAAIVESSGDAIISKTLESVITSWNAGAERIFGYPASEMIGESIYKLIPKDRQEEEPLILVRMNSGERLAHYETKRLTKDGRLIDVSISVSPLKDSEGNIIGLSQIARDITERKLDETRKNDFIGMVSHELKTPLTSLNALVQVANQKLKDSEDPFLAGAMAKANNQVRRMSTMINGFLNISRLESGKIQIDKHKFDMIVLIEEVIHETELTVATHPVKLVSSRPLTVHADRDKISSVVTNLINNAIKYSPKGNPIIINCDIVGNDVQVRIKDEGIGVKAEDQEKLFERYYRVENRHTERISGFGIGLYLSAEIIKRHSGQIWVESEFGQGSTFVFNLPLV